MKICVISTTIWPVPLKEYGGLEQVAYLCAEGLAKQGNEVLLVAPLGSVPPVGVELHGTTQKEPEQQAYLGYKDRLKNYDVIVDHSVVGSEKMLVRINGKSRWLSIAEVFDWAVAGSPAFIDKSGSVEVPVVGLEVPSASSPLSSGWKKVSSVIRHVRKDPIFRVKPKGLLDIGLTSGHGLITAESNETLGSIRADLAKGIPVACAASIEANPNDVSVLPIERGTLDFLSPRAKNKVTWPIPLTDDLLIFFGMWIGDGCYGKTSVCLASGKDTEGVSQKVAALFSARVRPSWHRPDVKHLIHSAALKHVMKSAGFEGYSDTKTVPDWVFDLSPRQIGLFLRGYFSADGHASKPSCGTLKICANTINRELALQIGVLLSLCGISPRVYGGQIYEVSVSRDQFEKFYGLVGFIQPQKMKSLHEMCSSHFSWRGDIPFSVVRERSVRSDTSGGHNRLVSLSRVGRLKPELIEKIKESGIVWRKVANAVEDVSCTDKYVYDLSVPKSENFLVGLTYCHNSWEKWAYMAQIDGGLKSPVVGVCHAPIETMYLKPPPLEKPCLVGISKDHSRRIQRHLGVGCRTVYNGVDLDFYRANGEKRNGRYLFMARMSKIKGPHVAVEVAQRTNVPLDVVGDEKFTNEPDYCKKVKAGCTGEIKYWGGVSRMKTVELYSTRKALLNSILWDAEPFGLVMVEAMACGLPVITFDRGSPREIVVHGETGFLVDGQEDMEALVKSDAVSSISPERCRERAAEFSKEKMGLRYHEVCQEAADGGW